MKRWYLLITMALVGWYTPTSAQDSRAIPAAGIHCPHQPDMTPPPPAQRQHARDLAAKGEQASLVGDNATARTLLQRAVELDPTDTNTVYTLARLDDATKEPHAAVAAYCHFLALAPSAPEAEEVRRRVASLTLERTVELPGPRQQHTLITPSAPPNSPPSPPPNSPPSHAEAAPAEHPPSIEHPPDKDFLLLATVLPGYGQYRTNRPLFGAVVTTATLASLYYAFEPKSVTIGTTQSRTATTYPHLVPALLGAGAISALAATEAYVYASKLQRALPVSLDITPSRVALWVPVALQGRLALGAVMTRWRTF